MGNGMLDAGQLVFLESQCEPLIVYNNESGICCNEQLIFIT